MTEQEKKTITFYDEHAKEWVAGHTTIFWPDELNEFHRLLPSGSVIDIGFGGGNYAEKLLAFGYDYVGIDPSNSFLQVAQSRNPKGTFHKLSVYDLDLLKQQFDGFLAVASLLHVPKARIPEALLVINRSIVPGGIGFISLKEGDGECAEKNTGRYFSYFREKEFTKFLEQSGFSVIKFARDERYVNNKQTKWLIFFVRKILEANHFKKMLN